MRYLVRYLVRYPVRYLPLKGKTQRAMRLKVEKGKVCLFFSTHAKNLRGVGNALGNALSNALGNALVTH